MKTVLITLFILLFSSSNCFGIYFEANCPNCSSFQARAAAQQASQSSTSGGTWQVYVHDLETLTLRTYNAHWVYEPGFQWVMVSLTTTPSDIQDDWSSISNVMSEFLLEPFNPIIVSPADYPSAYDVINNPAGMQQIFNKDVASQGWASYTVSLLLGAAGSLSTKITNTNYVVEYRFSDGSKIIMELSHFKPLTGEILINLLAAYDINSNPIYQDATDLIGSEFDTATSTSINDYFDRNNVDLTDEYGTPIYGVVTGVYVSINCGATATGVACSITYIPH